MSRTRYVFPALLFALVLLAHFIHSERRRLRRAEFDYGPAAWSAAASSYASRDKLWLGLSLATAAGFVAFWLKRPCPTRKQAIKGAGGGLALATVLHGVGCFLLGCCGSPMLAVYLGLFGPRFAGFTGPINFAITILSIAIACVWLKWRERAACGCADGVCSTIGVLPAQQAPAENAPEETSSL